MQTQRYPISIQVIGVMHKEKNKMYMTSVLWSDQNDIVVYRSFDDFKKIHKQMKKSFPPANPLKKSGRIIPKFQERKTRRSPRKKGPSRSVLRLKFLEKYCNDLLSCDPRVSQSPNLVQFFQPKDQDLQPEFAKNSIVIMPSNGELGGENSSAGNVTQPFVTETYRCVAPYETKDTKNKAFKVAVDEQVDVLIKDKAGWWLVENQDKQMAWFPAPYLEKMEDDSDGEGDGDRMDGGLGTGMLYTAARSYKATKVDEVSVEIGAVVEVLQKSENGWWLIRYSGKVGYLPSSYLQPYNNPRIRLAALQQDLRSSTLNLSRLQAPGAGPGLAGHPTDLSRSQGNMLQLPSSPSLLHPSDKNKSRSLNILSEPARSVQFTTDLASPGDSPTTPVTPTIRVELDVGEVEESDSSMGSQSSEFSLSDGLSSSSGSSFLNLSSQSENLRLSRTPPPMPSYHLSPGDAQGAKMTPSVSDPNLFKGPTTPKVPPRPRAKEILTRCTTVTRKNASKAGLSPVQAEILSR